jgi:cell division protein FtsB
MPIWVVPAVIALAIGTVWLRLSIVRTTYSINQSERRLSALRQEREQMELKLAGLRSPRRLELLARSKYGLSQPRAEQVVHLR